MNTNYLQEAFKEFEMLEEEAFDINSTSDIEQAKNYLDNSSAFNILDIIDPTVEDEEDLQDSYIGKIIVDCAVCHSKLYKDPSEIVVDEESGLVNIMEECPFCYSNDGYKIVGQVAPLDGDIESEEDVDAEVEDDLGLDADAEEKPLEDEIEESCNEDVCPECGKNPCECEKDEESLNEEVETIEIETDKEEIEVSVEPKDEACECEDCDCEKEPEILAPVEPEVIADVEDSLEEPEIEDEEEIFDLDDFDEEGFDKLGESYLTNVYNNVKSFKTKSVSQNGNSIKVEGLIEFNSGKQKETTFLFESSYKTKTGKLKFLGENMQMSRGKKSFILTGTLNESKFMCESLNYNYYQKDNSGESVKVHGKARV